jgi:neopullulanase
MTMKKTATIIFYILLSLHSRAQDISITRIEPPFWWTGMESQDLELMVYGPSIAVATVKVESKEIQLTGIQKTNNPNYIFLDLKISKDALPGKFPIIFNTKESPLKISYELKARREGAKQKPVTNGGDAMYLITPDRFANGDTTNDNISGMHESANRGINYGRHGGDIQGIIDHLDYIKKLGMTAIWLNPVLENNQPRYTYHGYAISNFYKIDPRFGTNDQYAELSAKAHALGLKVVMDQIFNHCGSAHWWMTDLPSANWINDTAIGRTNYNNACVSDPHGSIYDRTKHSRGYFDLNMPDLNQANPILATYMIQQSIWWVEFANLDALRIDTYPFSDKNFMAAWRLRMAEEYPNLFVVGEVWMDNVAYEAYWNSAMGNADGYDSHLNSITDYPLYYGMLGSFKKGGNVYEAYKTLTLDFLYKSANLNVVFYDNHDVNRTFAELDENIDRFKLASTFALTTRGVAQWYYGSEILMKGTGSDGYKRQDMPGGWPGDAKNVFSGKNLTLQETEALQFMTNLLNWRKNSKAIQQGSLLHFIPEDNVYVYFRISKEETVMIILNNGDAKPAFRLDRFKEVLVNYKAGKNILDHASVDLTKPLTLNAMTPYVIVLE